MNDEQKRAAIRNINNICDSGKRHNVEARATLDVVTRMYKLILDLLPTDPDPPYTPPVRPVRKRVPYKRRKKQR